jgi:predicted dehydrogenase
MKSRIIVLIIAALCNFNLFAQKQVKIGIIGLDTSHSTAFTKLLNGGEAKEFAGFKIVAAYPYGSQTIKSSYERIPKYIEEVKKYGVEVSSSIAELLKKVDCVMLETNDGNLHLEQAAEVLKAGKIMFVDKPLGASLPQAIAIFELAKQYNIPIFSSSALRFVPQNIKLRKGDYGRILGADCFSPHRRESSHPDFGWYGIHGVEILYTVMGAGCKSVSRMMSDSVDVVAGLWNNGRIGTFRGMQTGKSIYGGTVYTTNGAVAAGGYDGYLHLLKEILTFFKTGVAPVSAQETLEIFTFMEASNESARKGGKMIPMEETYKKGEKQAKKLLKKIDR